VFGVGFSHEELWMAEGATMRQVEHQVSRICIQEENGQGKGKERKAVVDLGR